MNRDLNKARKKHLERGLQHKLANSASMHKGVNEFLGWREAGDPHTLESYRMVRRKTESDKRAEDILPSPGVEEDVLNSEAQDMINDCNVLEGSLPQIEKGWKWVKQVQIATKPTEIAEAMVK